MQSFQSFWVMKQELQNTVQIIMASAGVSSSVGFRIIIGGLCLIEAA